MIVALVCIYALNMGKEAKISVLPCLDNVFHSQSCSFSVNCILFWMGELAVMNISPALTIY